MRKPDVKAGLNAALRSYGRAVMATPGANRFPRFAHYSRRYTPLILVGSIAWSYIPAHGAWFGWATLVLVYVMVYAIYCGISHTARLCEYCVRAFPLNGPELAAQCRRRLWVYHFHWKRWLIGPIAAELLITYAGPYLGLNGWANAAAWTPFALLFAWAVQRFFLTHDRLSAWCPWCRHNRPPEGEPIPDPDPAEGKPVPA